MKNLNLIHSRHNVNAPPRKSSLSKINFNDLTLVIKGTLEYTINDQKYIVCDGDMIFMPAGTSYVRKNSLDNADYISFNFTTDDEIHLPIFGKDVIHTEILMLISAYDRIASRTYLDNKEKFSHILGCILAVLEDRIKSRDYNPLTLKILKYIHANLDKKITLGDISELTFFSPIYCDTVFKREVGKSIIEYILDERVDLAKSLLREENLKISQVSDLVGFPDYNYFSRIFKARSGYSPSAYRKMTIDTLNTK